MPTFKLSGECGVTLNGHKSGITSLCFDGPGHRLASGSKDTCLIVWDVVNESGLYRLKGHKGPITRVSCQGQKLKSLRFVCILN
jgi:U3 small nucleolar RNA-associated protein 12